MSDANPIIPPRTARSSSSIRGSDELNLRDAIDLVISGRATILKITGVVVVLAIGLCLATTPSYQSSGSLQIDSGKQTETSLAGSDVAASVIGNVDSIGGEVEIIRSRLVLDPVIAKLNLEVVARPNYFPLLGAVLARHNSASATQPAAAVWGFGRWAWGGEQLQIDSLEVPREWLSRCMTLKKETGDTFSLRSFWGAELLRGRVGEHASSTDGRFQMLVSEIRARPGTLFTVNKNPHVDTVQNLVDQLDVRELANASGLIGIDFKASSAQLAAQFVNAVLASYVEQDQQRHAMRATRTREYLEKHLPELKQKLMKATRQVADYQREKDAPNVGKETSYLLQHRLTLQLQRLDAQTALDEARHAFGPQSTKIKDLQQRVAAVEREQQELEARIVQLPGKSRELKRLVSDARNLSTLHDVVQSAINSYTVAEAGSVSSVRIVDSASEPDEPVSLSAAVILTLSVPFGLLLGIGSIFAQRAMLRGLDHPKAVERTSGLPLRLSVFFSRRQAMLATQPARQRAGSLLLAELQPDDAAIDAIRTFSDLHPLLGVVMLCGAAPGTGKTFITANLGALLAQSGRSVVVVDANLRAGRMHQYFGVDEGPGISDFIAGSAAAESLIRRSEIEGLDYLACGARQPGAVRMLRSPRFAELLRWLATSYQTVLVTAPAVLAAPDATIIGQAAGTTLLILGATRHRPSEIQDAVRRLSDAGVTIDGIVLNRVGELPGSYGYRGYGVVRYEYA